MKESLSLTYNQVGLIGTGNFIGYLCLAVLGGFLAALFGARKIIFISLMVMGICLFLTGLSESFGFAFAMRLITGMGNEGSYIPVIALPAAWQEGHYKAIEIVPHMTQPYDGTLIPLKMYYSIRGDISCPRQLHALLCHKGGQQRIHGVHNARFAANFEMTILLNCSNPIILYITGNNA